MFLYSSIENKFFQLSLCWIFNGKYVSFSQINMIIMIIIDNLINSVTYCIHNNTFDNIIFAAKFCFLVQVKRFIAEFHAFIQYIYFSQYSIILIFFSHITLIIITILISSFCSEKINRVK